MKQDESSLSLRLKRSKTKSLLQVNTEAKSRVRIQMKIGCLPLRMIFKETIVRIKKKARSRSSAI